MSHRTATMRRYGGDWQPLLERFDDAVAALSLPNTAWAVLSCPIDGMDLDPDFVALIDRDADGRVRADDVRAAVEWTASLLRDHSPITAGSAELDLGNLTSAASAQAATGRALAEKLGLAPEAPLQLADLHNTEALCQCGDRDGDGVVPVHCIDGELAEAAADILSVCEPELDRHGKPGITLAVIDAFRAARDAWLVWRAQPGPHDPWGAETEILSTDLLRCDGPVQAWFLAAELSRVDAELPIASIAEFAPPIDAARDPQALLAATDVLPLAPLPHGTTGDVTLAFDRLYPGTLRALLRRIQHHLFTDDEAITLQQWDAMVAVAKRVRDWHAEGDALGAGELGRQRLETLDDEILTALSELCVLDAENQASLSHLQELEQLLVYQRDLFSFCRNFIALTDLITPQRRALFERGTLVLGGREFHFAMRVRDLKAHKPLAEESGIFVLYVEVSYRYTVDDEAVKEIVAVPVTRGTSDGLFKHRRGIFVDRDGHNHEAVIVDLVENPVSLQEALLAPFERVGLYISGKLEKWSEKLETNFDKKVTEVSKAPPPAAAGGLTPLMGGTVAFAALGSAFAFVTKQLSELGGPKILLALVVVCVLIMVPTVLLAAIRLHRRNLAGLIAASGWALNDRMRLTAGLGRLFTRRPSLSTSVVRATRDMVSEQLANVDPGAAWRAHTATIVRGASAACLLVLLFCVALSAGDWWWLDWAVMGASTSLLAVLIVALLEALRLGRFRPVFWWPVLMSPLAIVLTAVYAMG